jgi:DNA polymerase (family 10)
MYNSKISELLEEIAAMLELDMQSERRFEVLAYRKAAMTIGSMQQDVGDIYSKGGVAALMELPGVGKGIAGAIKEYVETGHMAKYDDLKKRYPVDFNTLTKIPGLGAKRVFKLYSALKIRDLADLKKAVESNRIRSLEGFGKKSELEIAKGIAILESGHGRMVLGKALPEAEAMVAKLRESGLVGKIAIAGSARRMRETVGDLDILIASKYADKVSKFISSMPQVDSIVLSGPTKTTVRLRIGLNCDFRIVNDESFGAALQYFTGNKDHNVKVRQIAIGLGYKLNEYGLFDGRKRSVGGPEEEDIYAKLGMQMMDPEMREDRGEVELSLKHAIPKVVQTGDIKGDLHTHTKATDGMNSVLEMAQYAKKLGRQYIGISDHSKSEYQAHGLDDKKMLKHLAEIDRANGLIEGIRILKSSEIDILKDGSLDLERKTMEQMDYTLCSVHTSLNMPKEEMTKRVITAMESGYMSVFAHPTDRIINQRRPIEMDLDRVFQAAQDNGVVLEIDAYPDRLDLNDENIIKAMGYKIMFSVDTDAHRTDHLDFMKYGVSMAKRGWLTAGRIVNTMPVEKMLAQMGR